MEFVTILRELWHRRTYVALVALLALLVGAAVAFKLPTLKSRTYTVGVADARVLVDTPRSQVLEVAPNGSDTLAMRANLIANLMAEGVVKDAIAKRAGLKPDQLEGVAQTTTAGGTGDATTPKSFEVEQRVLTTRVIMTLEGDQLPIIDIETQAPTTAEAAKLANASVAGLRDFINSKAASEQVPEAKRLKFTPLGPAQAGELRRGPGVPIAILATLFVFFGGCAVMLVVLALARGWRAVEEEEFLSDVFDDDPFEPSPGGPHSLPEDDQSNVSQMWTDWPEPALPPEGRRNQA
jgi:capsular polysaccharide biosynthesis protein